MLYDPQGNPISERTAAARPPRPGTVTQWQSADRTWYADAGRDLTPEDVDRIMRAADTGDTAELAALAQVIEERCWDAITALQTRRMAVAQTPWEIVPGDDSAPAKAAAEKLTATLNRPPPDTGGREAPFSFAESMFYEQMSALMPGWSVVEVAWAAGGEPIGFRGIEQKHFTFRDSRRPMLVTEGEPNGVELDPVRFIVHRYCARSGDMARGGLVRPLAWLWCFQSLAGVKDLLGFTERYGMPFVFLTVEENAFKDEKTALQNLVRNFGSFGGGVFTKAVEAKLLQAAAGGGDVFFKLLEYVTPAIEKLVLGQLATGSDGGGWSNDSAQDKVRGDLRAADCEGLELTNRRQFFSHWTRFNCGGDCPVPKLQFDVKGREDKKALAETLKTLNDAGYRPADDADVSERFGIELVRVEPAASPPPAAGGTAPGGDQAQNLVQGEKLNGAQIQAAKDVLDGVARGGTSQIVALELLVAVGIAQDKASRMVDAAKAQPPPPAAALSAAAAPRVHTLRGTFADLLQGLREIAADAADPDTADEIAATALAEARRARVLQPVFGGLQAELDRVAAIADDSEFATAADALATDLPALFERMDATQLEAVLGNAMITGAARGAAERAAGLQRKERGGL